MIDILDDEEEDDKEFEPDMVGVDTDDSTHINMINLFKEYIIKHDKFTRYNQYKTARDAKHMLTRIAFLAKKRQKEIESEQYRAVSRYGCNKTTWPYKVADALTKIYNQPFSKLKSYSGIVAKQMGITQSVTKHGSIKAPDDWVHFKAYCKQVIVLNPLYMMHGRSKDIESWDYKVRLESRENEVSVTFIFINPNFKFVMVKGHESWDRTVPHTHYYSPACGHLYIYNFNRFFKSVNAKVLEFLSINGWDKIYTPDEQ